MRVEGLWFRVCIGFIRNLYPGFTTILISGLPYHQAKYFVKEDCFFCLRGGMLFQDDSFTISKSSTLYNPYPKDPPLAQAALASDCAKTAWPGV